MDEEEQSRFRTSRCPTQFLALLGVVGLRKLKKKIASLLVLNTHKCSEATKVQDDRKEDFISGLPDEILCSILSKLATEEAVRTSILSTRWRNIYFFLPNLSLNCLCVVKNDHHCCCGPQDQRGFLTMINRFLQLPRDHKIMSLQLSFCLGKEYNDHLERWIEHIARMGIEELQLRFSCDSSIVDLRGKFEITEWVTFPFQFLSEASMLRSLCLSSCNLEQNILGPFKSLTYLRLEAVPLVNEEVQNIFLSCSKLKSLTLVSCELPAELFISGPEMELKSLSISNCVCVEEIVLCAGNLTTLEIVCSNRIKFSPSYVPKLQQVHWCLNDFDDFCYIIGFIMKGVPQVESLYIRSLISELFYLPAGVSSFGNPLPSGLSSLCHLSQLSLYLVFEDIFDVQQLANLIAACPLLQRFHLATEGESRLPIGSATLSPVYHDHLKEIDYGGFYGLRNEIQLVLFILQSAVSLEQIVISKDYRYCIGEGNWEKSEGHSLSEKQLQTLGQLFKQQAVSQDARIIMC